MMNHTEKFLARMIHAALNALDLNAVGYAPIQVMGLVISLKTGTAVCTGRSIEGCVQLSIRSCDTSNPLNHNLVWGVWSVDDSAPTFYPADARLQDINLLDVECIAKLIHAMAVDYYPHDLIQYLHSAQGAAFHIADVHRAGVHAIVDAATKGITFSDEQKTYLLGMGRPVVDQHAPEEDDEPEATCYGDYLFSKLLEEVAFTEDPVYNADEVRAGMCKRYPQPFDGKCSVSELVATFCVTMYENESFGEANKYPQLTAALLKQFPETRNVFAAMTACQMSVDEMCESLTGIEDLECDLISLVERLCALLHVLNCRDVPYSDAMLQSEAWETFLTTMHSTIKHASYYHANGETNTIAEILRIAHAENPVRAKQKRHSVTWMVKKLGLNPMFATFNAFSGDSIVRVFVEAFDAEFCGRNMIDTTDVLPARVAERAPGKEGSQYVVNAWPEATECVLRAMPIAYVQALAVMIAMKWGVVEFNAVTKCRNDEDHMLARLHQFIQMLNRAPSIAANPESWAADAASRILNENLSVVDIVGMFRVSADDNANEQTAKRKGRPITSTLPRSVAHVFDRPSHLVRSDRALSTLDVARAVYHALDQDVGVFGYESFNRYWQAVNDAADSQGMDMSYLQEQAVAYLNGIAGDGMGEDEISTVLAPMPLAAVSVFFIAQLLGTDWASMIALTKNISHGSKSTLGAIAVHTVCLVKEECAGLYDLEMDESVDEDAERINQKEAEHRTAIRNALSNMTQSMQADCAWLFKSTGDE